MECTKCKKKQNCLCFNSTLPFNSLSNSEFKIAIDSLRHDPKLVEAMSELDFNALDDDLCFQLSNIDALKSLQLLH